MRKQYVLNLLEPLLKDILDFYDISHIKADSSIYMEEGCPIGTDVFIISCFFKSEMYVHRMYIKNEYVFEEINQQIEKLIECLKVEICRKEKIKSNYKCS